MRFGDRKQTVKDVKEILTDASLAGSATTALADCTALDLAGVKTLALTVRCTYNALSSTGVTVNLYTSVDNLTWDIDVLTSFEPSFNVGSNGSAATIQKTVFIDPDCYYLKVRVTNKDESYAVTDLTIKSVCTK